MSKLIYIVAFLFPGEAFSLGAALPKDGTVPIRVQYYKNGTESQRDAEKLGQDEIDSDNPCVKQMYRELEPFAKKQSMKDAVKIARKDFSDAARLQPVLVLKYVHGSMEVNFELRSPAVRNAFGALIRAEDPKYRKTAAISNIPGDWKDRVDADLCHVTNNTFQALLYEIHETERLEDCLVRKRELLGPARKVAKYTDSYLPTGWIEQAKKRLERLNTPVNRMLKIDQTEYRAGSETYQECAKGLRKLEEDAADSLLILKEVKAVKQETDLPEQEMKNLEQSLSGPSK